MDTNSDQNQLRASDEAMQELGAIVLETAVLRFLSEADDEVAEAFEAFVAARAEQETLIDEACVAYPEFAFILEAEMRDFVEDAKALNLTAADN